MNQKIIPNLSEFFNHITQQTRHCNYNTSSVLSMANTNQGNQDMNKDKSDLTNPDKEIQTKISKIQTENSSFETSGKTSGYSENSNSNSALDMVNLAQPQNALITQNGTHQMTQQITPLSSHAIPSNLNAGQHSIPIQHLSQNNSTESVADMSTDSNNFNDEVRTLFVSGLPMDVKQRELYKVVLWKCQI